MSRHQIVADAKGYRCACGEGPFATSYAWACHAVGFSAETLLELVLDRATPLLSPLEQLGPDAPDAQEVTVRLGLLRDLRDAIDVTGALVRAPRA